MKQMKLFDEAPEGYEYIFRRCVRKKNGKGWICARKGKYLKLLVRKRKQN